MKISSSLLLLAGFTFLILPSPAPAQPLPTPSPPPRIEFEETEYDSGDAWEGDKISHIFKFKNTGGSTLIINRVRTSCGCTAALASNKNLEPGQAGEIKAEFDTKRFRGNQKKTIYVSSNDPLNPTVKLKLSSNIKSVAHFTPRTLNFRKVTRGEEAALTIKVIPEMGGFNVTDISATPDIFQARVIGEKTEVGEKKTPIEIEVTLSPEAPRGRHTGSLTVRTDHPKLPKLNARLSAQVEGLLKYSPRMLLFRPRGQEEGQVKKVKLTTQGKGELKIHSVESSIPQFQAELTTLEPSREYEIAVQLKPGQPEGRYQGFIIIRTNLEGEEEIKIPVTANIRFPEK